MFSSKKCSKMKQKIKVLHIEHCSHSYFVTKPDQNLDDVVRGSWGTQVAREIKKYHPEIEVECFFPEKVEKKEREFFYEKIKIRIFPTTFSPKYALDFSIPMLKAISEEIKKAKKENIKLILHIHEYHNLHGLAISRLFRGEKMIAQHHGGSWPLKHMKQTGKYKPLFMFFALGQMWEDSVLKNIKIFYALSKEEIEYLKEKAPKSEIRFQTMGIEDGYFKKESKSSARKKLGLSARKKILLYIGRISEIKGMSFLLDAMENMKDIELKCIGFGPEEEKFKEYAREKRLKNVEFLGGVFGEKKMLYLSAADALILPSSKEGAPVVIMEALARNLPVVTTDAGGVLLMIEDKREGVIINQRDSKDIERGIREILQWKKNVRKYAEKYKWKSIIDETVKDYEKI